MNSVNEVSSFPADKYRILLSVFLAFSTKEDWLISMFSVLSSCWVLHKDIISFRIIMLLQLYMTKSNKCSPPKKKAPQLDCNENRSSLSCILDKGHLKVHQAGWHSHEIFISKWKCCIWLSLTISYNCQFHFGKNLTPHIHIWCIAKVDQNIIITTPDMTRNRCKPSTIFRSFIAMIKHRKDHLW